jgi:hypothetical protein
MPWQLDAPFLWFKEPYQSFTFSSHFDHLFFPKTANSDPMTWPPGALLRVRTPAPRFVDREDVRRRSETISRFEPPKVCILSAC